MAQMWHITWPVCIFIRIKFLKEHCLLADHIFWRNIMDIQKKLKYNYIYKDDYNPVYVNGAYGGISTTGEIVMNFYLERHGIPKSQTHNIREDGSLGELVETIPKDQFQNFVRYIETGVILELDHAIKINKWLNDKIEQLKEIKLKEDQKVKKESKKK